MLLWRLNVDVLRLGCEDGLDWLAAADDRLDERLLSRHRVSAVGLVDLREMVQLRSELGWCV